MFADLVGGIAFVDVAAALVSVGASILGVIGIYQCIFWVMEMLGFEYDSVGSSGWYRVGSADDPNDPANYETQYDENGDPHDYMNDPDGTISALGGGGMIWTDESAGDHFVSSSEPSGLAPGGSARITDEGEAFYRAQRAATIARLREGGQS